MGTVRILRLPLPLLLGLRLHLVCTLGGLPVAFVLTGPTNGRLCSGSWIPTQHW